jgi:hypothetical protein
MGDIGLFANCRFNLHDINRRRCNRRRTGAKLNIKRSTYEILKVLGISLLDKTPVKELFINVNYKDVKEPFDNQLSLSLF